MNRLIDAFKGLFTAASISGGALAKTANFTLENVNWKGELSKPEPVGHPILDTHLVAACADSGQAGSSSEMVARALLVVTDELNWHVSSTDCQSDPDIAVFSRKFASACVIGNGGLLPSDQVAAGVSLQGRDTYYPPHAHPAEESYWIIGGDGDWKVGTQPWFAVKPGDSIYHESGARHAMQTNEQPLLAVWLWTSHLHSDVVIVRG